MGTSISQIITVTTAALGVLPGPANNLVISNLSTTSLTFSWDAPSTGSTPFTYQPQMSLAGPTPTWTNIGSLIAGTSVAVTGLTPNVGYQFQVITSNDTGNSTSGSVTTTTLSIAPGSPTGLAVVGNPTQTSASLVWNAPSVGTPPLSYQLFVATPSGSGVFLPIGSPTQSLTEVVTGLASGSSFDFQVVASNVAGAGGPSTPLSNVQTTGGSSSNAPGPITLFVASSITATAISLSWIAPTTGTPPFTYQAQISLAGTPPIWTNIGAPTQVAAATATNLVPNTAYQFQVITTNGVGTNISASIGASTLAVLPGPVTGLAVSGTPTQTSISLTWVTPATGSPPLTYQVVSRSPTGSGLFTPAAAVTGALSQTITGLTPGTSYDFETFATNSAGTGAASATLANVQTAAGSTGNAPSPATGLTISALTTTSLTLSWTAPTTGLLPFTYQPQRALAGSSPTWTNIGGSITGLSVGVTGLTPNTAYQFQIITTNSAGTSTSASQGATTLAVLPSAPGTPTLVGTPTQTTVSLAWTAPVAGTPPFTYQVFGRRPSGSGPFVTMGPATLNLTQTITGLTAGATYDFELNATNPAGAGPVSSALTNVSTAVSAPVLPSAPLNLTLGSATSSSLLATWSPPAAGTPPLSYVVQYRLH